MEHDGMVQLRPDKQLHVFTLVFTRLSTVSDCIASFRSLGWHHTYGVRGGHFQTHDGSGIAFI